MTENEKDLLIKDLCARLPYGVKVEYENEIFDVEHVCPMYEEVKLDIPETWTIDVSEVKPYLFPMSSMTKEQEKEYDKAYMKDMEAVRNNLLKFAKGEPILDGAIMYHHIEWLNKNKFDYRGLIPMGLANDATGKNIY